MTGRGSAVDQRTMDRLVKTIVDEIEQRGAPAASAASGGVAPSTRPVALVDNWRVRADHRAEFLEHYQRYVADVMRQLPGYRAGRVLASSTESSYSWHVQAFYEFDSADIVGVFRKEFEKALRKVKPGLTMDKVLDAMDPWVLAHEEGVLEDVWH